MNNLSDDERREVEELLPWYAAGTLSRAEVQRVEHAIANDSQLARAYQSVREELDGTVDLNEALGAPSKGAMEKLFANIDSDPARRLVHAPGIGERVSMFFASLSPRTLVWTASAAALAIVVEAGVIADALMNRPTNEFQTASSPGAATAEGVFAIVQFAPDASLAAVTELLAANSASIASGPSAGNLYRIRLGSAALPKEEVDKIIARLQQNQAIRFIAPAE
jgi:anti-sigma-K factor RskA